jgi:hypothetical protein
LIEGFAPTRPIDTKTKSHPSPKKRMALLGSFLPFSIKMWDSLFKEAGLDRVKE